MTRFEFATAQRIVFGAGTLKEIGGIGRGFGSRALVITGRNVGRAGPLLEQLAKAGVSSAVFSIGGEPTTDAVTAAVTAATEQRAEFVIGFGGGSAIDAAKAAAGLAANGGDLLDHLEIVGRAQPLAKPGLPCIAIPTTAGAGAEATRNAVLLSPAHRLKVSLRSPHILPRVALVDPELTLGLPPQVTASTGLDALTQLIEPFTSARANPVTDALCRDGIARAARALPRACGDGRDADARADMALASLLGGMALANSGLGAVHGFASPIGGLFAAPHGAVCAALLPHATALNIRALRARAPSSPALGKYAEVARLLTRSAEAGPEDAIAALSSLVSSLGIPRLGQYGLRPSDLPAIVKAAAASSSMKGNPILLNEPELLEILAAAL